MGSQCDSDDPANPASEQTFEIAAELGLMVQEEALIPGMVARGT